MSLCVNKYNKGSVTQNDYYLGAFVSGTKTFHFVLHIWHEGIAKPRPGM